MAIRHLKDIHDKLGDEFLNKLLNEYLIVNEKVNGNFFGFKKDIANDSFKFFNKKSEIGYIDKVLSRFYNEPINYIENLPNETIQKIPSNFYFGLEYISNTSSNMDEYGRLPENGLILNFIHEIDEKGEVVKTIQDKDILDEWSSSLGVEKPPIVFEGKLTDEQRGEILDFVYSPVEKLIENFKTKSFIKHIISVLNKNFNDSFLENSIIRDINGLIFRFYEDDREDPKAKVFLAKVIDPIFKNKIDAGLGDKKQNKSQDYTWLIVIDLMNFIESYDVKTIDSWKITGTDYQERYLKFINIIFKSFIDKFKDKYEGLELNKPDFLNSEEFDLNMDLINDPYILDLIKESDTYKEIYKILLNFFRKKRKKSNSPFFDSNMVTQLNLLVDKIKKMLFKEKVFEGFFPTFNEYVGEAGEFIPMTIDGFEKNNRSIAKPKKVNILIGSFQPINLGHIKAIEKLKSKNNLPVVLVSIIKDTPTENSPFSENSVRKMLNSVEQEYGKLIEKVILLKKGSIDDILGSLKPAYIPILWGTNRNKMDKYALQLNYLKKRHASIDINKDFKLVEIPKYQSNVEIRKLIKDQNYAEFKRLVPKSVASDFYNLKKEIDGLNESSLNKIPVDSDINNLNESTTETNVKEEEK